MADDSAPSGPIRGTTRLVLAGLVLLFNLPLLHFYVFRRAPEATVTVPFQDDFSDPGTLTRSWSSTGALWRVQGGALFGPGPKGSPLWLKAKLPSDVAIDFDVASATPAADIQVHLFGDGTDVSSGYVLVNGAGGGGLSTMGRLGLSESPTMPQRLATARLKGLTASSAGELVTQGGLRDTMPWHVVVTAPPPVPRVKAHWRVERVGAELRWSINGKEVGRLVDPLPLGGAGHDRFGLSGWEADLFFDDVRVSPLAAFAPASPPPQAAPPPAPPQAGAVVFADSFERVALGDDWGGLAANQAVLVDGRLRLSMMHNRPLWLKRPIPQNARLEFKARSLSPDGDLKVEAWGDGVSGYSGDLRLQYTATGYVAIFGGWRNTLAALAKQHEHTPDRVTRGDVRVEKDRWYAWTLERRDGRLRWLLDGQLFLERDDADPLVGPGHDHLGFSGWESTVEFDDVKVTSLD